MLHLPQSSKTHVRPCVPRLLFDQLVLKLMLTTTQLSNHLQQGCPRGPLMLMRQCTSSCQAASGLLRWACYSADTLVGSADTRAPTNEEFFVMPDNNDQGGASPSRGPIANIWASLCTQLCGMMRQATARSCLCMPCRRKSHPVFSGAPQAAQLRCVHFCFITAAGAVHLLMLWLRGLLLMVLLACMSSG